MDTDADVAPADPFLHPRFGGAESSCSDPDDSVSVALVASFSPPLVSSSDIPRLHPIKESMECVSNFPRTSHPISSAWSPTETVPCLASSQKRPKPRDQASSACVPPALGCSCAAEAHREEAMEETEVSTPLLSHRAGEAERPYGTRAASSEETFNSEDGGWANGLGNDGEDEGDSDESTDAAGEEGETTAAAFYAVRDSRGWPLPTTSSAAAPITCQWMVTDAFHVSLWYVLRYAGKALSAEDLWACRAILSITATTTPSEVKLPSGAGGHGSRDLRADREVVDTDPKETALKPSQIQSEEMFDNWTWRGSEECELFLRLVLRKPFAFTADHLERRYGEWMHVQPTLEGLSKRRVLWWPSSTNATGPISGDAVDEAGERYPKDALTAVERQDAVQPPTKSTSPTMVPAPLLRHYDGKRVSRLLVRGIHAASVERSINTTASSLGGLSLAQEEVIRVLQAVRAPELRQFLSALRQLSKACAKRSGCASLDKTRFVTAASMRPAADALPGSTACESGAEGTVPEAAMHPFPATVEDTRERRRFVPPHEVNRDDNSLYDAIPGRKQDMITYLVERRYSVWFSFRAAQSGAGGTEYCASAAMTRDGFVVAPNTQQPSSVGGHHRAPRNAGGAAASVMQAKTKIKRWCGSSPNPVVTNCFLTREEEEDAVAFCWNRFVGPVYAPHTALKQRLKWITELFHVLTSNNGSGSLGSYGLQAVAATMAVAAPPTLLMLHPQLLLLWQTLHAARNPHPSVVDIVMPSSSNLGGVALARADRFVAGVPRFLLPPFFSSPPSTDSFSSTRGAHVEMSGESGSQSGRGGVLSGNADPVSHVDNSSATFQEEASVPLVHLFSHPTILNEYREALAAQQTLYDVTDGAGSAAQRFRGRNVAFVSHMFDTVMAAVRAGVAAVRLHPHAAVATSASSAQADAWRFVCDPSAGYPLTASEVQASFTPHFSRPRGASLYSLLYQRGCYAEHLLTFTPLYRWFACLEILFPLLESARRYADANACLHYLLDEPIFVLHHVPDGGLDVKSTTSVGRRSNNHSKASLSPITYTFRYNQHKRGKWIARLAQNLSHLKRHAEALSILEDTQAGYVELARHSATSLDSRPCSMVAEGWAADNSEQARLSWWPFRDFDNPIAANLCAVLAGDTSPDRVLVLPSKVQRRARLLRALWPTSASLMPSSCHVTPLATAAKHTAGLAVLHAAWEYIRDRYCRRHDRLAVERLLAIVHRKVRQWTPLSSRRELATSQMSDVTVRRVKGVRDVLDGSLWREPSDQTGNKRTTTMSGATAVPASESSSVLPHSTRSQRRPASQVEYFVLHHFLSRWNEVEKAGERMLAGAETSTDAGLRERKPVMSIATKGEVIDQPGNKQEESLPSSCSSWYGVHCEGQWIACLARALLWDCYWTFPWMSPRSSHASENTHGQPSLDESCDVLWLSAFQDGPLDLITPIRFLERRKAVIEARLSQLEKFTREELIACTAARIKVEVKRTGVTSASPDHPLSAKSKALPTDDCDEEGEELAEDYLPLQSGVTTTHEKSSTSHTKAEPHVNPCTSKDLRCSGPHFGECADPQCGNCDDSVLICSFHLKQRDPYKDSSPPPPFPSEADQEEERKSLPGKGERAAAELREALSTPSLCASTPFVPEAWKVPVGQLPLLAILRAIPLPPLWRFLRCLYLSPVTEGVPLRFSGFPDLVLWRQSGGSGRAAQATHAAVRHRDAWEDSSMPTSDFCLMEVKSPSDVLSTGQIAVNDLLHRCGFTVCVVRVEEVYDHGGRVTGKRVRSKG